MTALLGNQIPITITALSGGIGQAKAGTIKALAVTTATRSAALPDVPTVSEAADLPGFDVSTWTGVLAPAGTPPDIVAKLNTDIVTAMKMPDVQSALGVRGLTVVAGSGEEFGEVIAKEITQWRAVLQEDAAK
jgi:tripartite-type tricarboxylate transporter receptor subunit TctC